MKIPNPFRHLNVFRHAYLRLTEPGFAEVVERPIFVVGCGHSGTTLLLRIIGSHPNIHTILNESATFTKNQTYNLRNFDMTAYAAGKKRWIEKTPLHIHHIGAIFKRRPGAKVIIIVRDGRDVAASIKKRKGNLKTGVDRWVRDNEAGEKWWPDPRIKVLKYEDLIADFEGTIRATAQFLGEDYNQRMKDYHQNFKKEIHIDKPPDSPEGENHLKYRMWQVEQPMFDGRGRWVQELAPSEKELVKQKAGEMLVRYGYATDLNW